MRGSILRRALAVGTLALAACGDGPERAGDRFVDLYFVEIDQQRALALTAGPARARLEEELALVAGVRRDGYRASDARANVYYERIDARRSADGASARLVYDLRIRVGPDETRKHVLVSLHHDREGWRVQSFHLQEGPAPAVPANRR